jgi:hypothetical protein
MTMSKRIAWVSSSAMAHANAREDRLGFTYSVPGTLDEPGRESFQLYCESSRWKR